MDGEKMSSYQDAFNSYQKKDFDTAANICAELYDDENQRFQALMLATCIFVQYINPNDKNTHNNFITSYSVMVDNSPSYEAYLSASYFIDSEYDKYVFNVQKKYLDREFNSPSNTSITGKHKNNVAFAHLKALVSLQNMSKVKALQEKDNLSDEETCKLGEKYQKKIDYHHELLNYQFELGKKLLDRTYEYFKNNSCISVSRVETVSTKLVNMLSTTEFWVKDSIGESKGDDGNTEIDVNEDELLERLIVLAQIKDLALRATLNIIDKGELTLITNRTSTYNELIELYNRISSLKEGFQAPELPDLEAKTINNLYSSNTTSSSSGCYIATCVYGSYDCPQVWVLRRYRDYCLDKTWYGRLFIKIYYAISPLMVKIFGERKWFKRFWTNYLDSMIKQLQIDGYDCTPYTDKY